MAFQSRMAPSHAAPHRQSINSVDEHFRHIQDHAPTHLVLREEAINRQDS